MTMTIIKCKMCGGDIQMNAEKTYGTCDHCGSTMTLPKIADERKANLFNRANHFRRQNDFDKALQAYENILNEDNADAEAHWGVVLSRYGIEYVEDPATRQRIPTCHRVQGGSVLADPDYLAALEHSPNINTRLLYEEEAKKISETQKGILAISSKEAPYDIFICYKETDNSGQRTKDSIIAQDIYYQLINDGYRIFFARITLEDKLGQQYEPYIFSALNSAKVMLVIGTQKEYFEAVWVKNEWSRFLSIMQKDRSRLLIPCYRDMDAYDLPEEMSMLSIQAQDMGKIGFIQDLARNIKKVFEPGNHAQTGPVVSGAPKTELLLKRVFMFLEDGDWKQADEYCERTLDADPENASAYIGKLMAALQIRKEKDLAGHDKILTEYSYFQKAVRFADEKTKERLTAYGNAVYAKKTETAYDDALAIMENGRDSLSERRFLELSQTFGQFGNYRDAKNKMMECENLAEMAKRRENEMRMAVDGLERRIGELDARLSPFEKKEFALYNKLSSKYYNSSQNMMNNFAKIYEANGALKYRARRSAFGCISILALSVGIPAFIAFGTATLMNGFFGDYGVLLVALPVAGIALGIITAIINAARPKRNTTPDRYLAEYCKIMEDKKPLAIQKNALEQQKQFLIAQIENNNQQ
ncbi:MAG: toll/interleukin-1 receptor domain-containing protein [Oscillospiraceae bacterium]|nr:toll/interleukin-1 receptor domain-containing protein [Oscillospiraceae bacterium]